MVVAGLTVIVGVDCDVDQIIVPPTPPGKYVGLNVTLCPEQIAVSEIVINGVGATVTITVELSTHPFAAVTTTVYVPAVAILTFTLLPKPLFQAY